MYLLAFSFYTGHQSVYNIHTKAWQSAQGFYIALSDNPHFILLVSVHHDPMHTTSRSPHNNSLIQKRSLSTVIDQQKAY